MSEQIDKATAWLRTVVAEPAFFPTAAPCALAILEQIADLRSQLAAERDTAQKLLRESLALFPDICQLLDGWHCDVAWTPWDESIRQRCSDLQRKVFWLLEPDEARRMKLTPLTPDTEATDG